MVFVTAFDQHAVQAFEQGALDYLVKPIDEARLATTVARLQQRLVAPSNLAAPATLGEGMLQRLAELVAASAPAQPERLRWIKASLGATVKLIPVEQVAYLRSDEKYTQVVWQGGQALIRRGLKELAEELDPQQFVQVHRSVSVNLAQVAQVVRSANETAEIHLHGRTELLPVSRSSVHRFKQM